MIVECRLVDDLPPALVGDAGHASPDGYSRACRPPSATGWNRRSAAIAEPGWLYVRYRSPLGLAERWAKAPLTQTVRVYPALRTGEEQQIFLARSRQIDLQLRQCAAARPGTRLREPARVPRGRRPARHLLDGHRAARQPHHAPVSDRAQPAGVDRARLRAAHALACGSANPRRPALAPQFKNPNAEPRAHVHSKLDHACTTAVSLAQLALYSGDRVGLLAYGQGIQQRLLPGRGAAHLRQLIESLAQVRAEASEADHLRATATTQPPAAAPRADSLDHRPGRIRHAP